MRETSILEKVIPALVNVVAVFLAAQIFLPFTIDLIGERWTIILVYFIYSVVFLFLKKGRDLGMIIFDTHWQKKPTRFQKLVYAILDTGSFATLLFAFYFRFDLFLANMVLLQLPSILFSDKTFQGLVTGMATVTRN
jgi:hypothetical protein